MRFREVGLGDAILNWGRELGVSLGVLGAGGWVDFVPSRIRKGTT